MKKRKWNLLALLMVFVFLVNICLTACGEDPVIPDEPPQEDPPVGGIPEDEWTLPKQEGYNQVTFYWDGDYDIATCDLWAWWDGKEGSGNLFHACEYGMKAVINVPVGIDQVGFIVRRDCSEPGGTAWGSATKDWEEDRFAVLEGTDTYIWLKSGDVNQYTSQDGGKTLSIIQKFVLAGMVDYHTIKYNITPKTKIESLSDVKVFDGSEELTVTKLTTLGMDASSGYITVEETLDIGKVYYVSLPGFGDKAVVPTEVFDTEEFIRDYAYDGDDLGAVIHGEDTTFKVWAPTASRVVLSLYDAGSGGNLLCEVDMVKGESGVWSHTQTDCGHGTYYTYTVTTSVGTQVAQDPYAKSAGVNGNRSMVIDMARTNPDGWTYDNFDSGIDSYTDVTIWEVHVRDFSNKITSSKYPGKYLAFTETGLVNEHGISVGVDYLKELGITHIHLLPVYDFATVDETKPDEQFNWGYDPKNYNVPEGSYATDPHDGAVRVTEFKQMVQALHDAGIGVIMDVVYNHTYDANSSFNRIVPYYYYRYTANGTNSSASGCGNDTASERYMYRKFMVDSVTHWIREYNLDGFRFDLMGLHDLATMQAVENAVHQENPQAVIYGEGWTMGSTIDGSQQANQTFIKNITPYQHPTDPSKNAIGGIAVFNDKIRDGLKGSVFEETSVGYINGNGANKKDVIFGIKGGYFTYGISWSVKNAHVINYMSAHDNHTLWDKLLLSAPNASKEERMAMNRLGAAILMVSQGTPFWQAGEEMLRTKDGDHNSYKSSDEINNIDWSVLSPDSDEYKMMLYYKGLIAMRNTYDIFRHASGIEVSVSELANNALAIKLTDHATGERAIVLINPTATAMTYTLTGEWHLVADGTRSGSESLATETGDVTVEGISVRIYVN